MSNFEIRSVEYSGYLKRKYWQKKYFVIVDKAGQTVSCFQTLALAKKGLKELEKEKVVGVKP